MVRSIISRDIGLKKIGGDSLLTSLLYSQTEVKKNIRSSIIVLFPSASRSLTRCSATQNIEEAARSDGGVKEISTTEETHQGINTPPLLIADKIGGVPTGRGG